MIFATKPTTYLTLGMLLHCLGKLKIQFFCRYSADMEENSNKLHFECTSEYWSPMIRHGQSCGSAACPVDSRLNLVLLRFQNVSCRSVSVGFAEKNLGFRFGFHDKRIVNFFMTKVIWHDFHHHYFER